MTTLIASKWSLPVFGCFPQSLFSQQQIGGDKDREDYADNAVHGEEGGVKFGEIGWFHEGVFVEEEQRHCDDSGKSEPPEAEGGEQSDKKDQHEEVKRTGDPQGGGDANVARDGVESRGTVEVEILAGVEDVESGDPEGYGGGEEKDARVERAANCDPGGGRGDAESEAED